MDDFYLARGEPDFRQEFGIHNYTDEFLFWICRKYGLAPPEEQYSCISLYKEDIKSILDYLTDVYQKLEA